MKVTIEIPREVLEKLDRFELLNQVTKAMIIKEYVDEVLGLGSSQGWVDMRMETQFERYLEESEESGNLSEYGI